MFASLIICVLTVCGMAYVAIDLLYFSGTVLSGSKVITLVLVVYRARQVLARQTSYSTHQCMVHRHLLT